MIEKALKISEAGTIAELNRVVTKYLRPRGYVCGIYKWLLRMYNVCLNSNELDGVMQSFFSTEESDPQENRRIRAISLLVLWKLYAQLLKVRVIRFIKMERKKCGFGKCRFSQIRSSL